MGYAARYVATNLLFLIVLADITFSTESLTVVGGLLAALTSAVVFLFRLLTQLNAERIKAMEAEKLAIIELIRAEHATSMSALHSEHSNAMAVMTSRFERMEAKVELAERMLADMRKNHVECVEKASVMLGKLTLLAEQEEATRARVSELESKKQEG